MATNYQGSFRVGGNPNNPFGSIINLLIFFAVLAGMYFFIGGVFKLLYLVAPLLLIATLIINYRIVAEYAIDVFETFRTDVLWGAVKVAFTVVCYPLVIGWLFAKSLIYRKVDKIKQQFEEQVKTANPNLGSNTGTTEFADFEELSSEMLNKSKKQEPPIIIELPKLKEKPRDDYDQFFK
jgi:Trk-type K+ transport system membrane component